MADFLIWTGARSEIDYPIVERTGLVGRFDIDLEFVPQDDSARNDIRIGLPFIVAVEEQLGLRFEPRVEALDVLVVDGIAKPSLD